MAREDSRPVGAVISNLIVTTIWITAKAETSFAVERPIHLAIGVLLLCALVWSALGRWAILEPSADFGDRLTHRNDHTSSRPPIESETRLLRRFRTCRLSNGYSNLLVVCIVLRILAIRAVVLDVQCSWDGVEAFLPLVVALLQILASRQNSQHSSNGPNNIVTLGVASFAAFAASLSAPRSTYICPSLGNLSAYVHAVQCVGLLLDACILFGVTKILRDAEDPNTHWKVLSRLALSSAGAITVLAGVCLWRNPRLIAWAFRSDSKFVTDILFASILCTNFITSIIYLTGDFPQATLVAVITFVSVYFSALQHQITASSGSSQAIFILLCLVLSVCVTKLLRSERDSGRAQKQTLTIRSLPRTILGLSIFLSITITFIGTKFMIYPSHNKWTTHPINALMAQARSTSSKWQRQAATSKTLKEAVVEYHRRYGIPPPPRFDKWYEFATSRNSRIIDDFDQIHNDLLPFWGVEPAQIRSMTGHMLERPWTEIAGLRIANGTTAVGVHMPPTHRWMVEGAGEMINTFAEWLPEMDLAFNINDESRVAIPWEKMQSLKYGADVVRRRLNQTKDLKPFSTDRLQSWRGNFLDPEPPFPPDSPSEYFAEASIASSFDRYGAIGCPPKSPARNWKWWNRKLFCYYCAAPHSLGKFVSDWTLSGYLCHQPDVGHLHGFHLSPSAFKPTKGPFPVFSQSKIPTYSDIVFPSPWNYKKKVTLDAARDMAYSEKDNAVFWRGATSEGFSVGGNWEGMQRQRFVNHLNTTNTTSVTVLLPDVGIGRGYTQQTIPLSAITSITNISVSFVDNPTRCDGPDCDLQRTQFEFSGPVDFQEHWRHRFLFDLDGAGFSGRFLPFIQSRSLVFRVASFRQWFDERLTAWAHFVPVDGRLREVWDLLAYFGGTSGGEAAKIGEGERIAEEGRDRASKVLRNEDMEIYMFRLLLEWARIVDDNREEMGFDLNGKG